MVEEEIDKLRDKLYLLIIEKAEYSEVLKVSQELDTHISEIISEKLKSTSSQPTVTEK